jgi:hypothetical protein
MLSQAVPGITKYRLTLMIAVSSIPVVVKPAGGVSCTTGAFDLHQTPVLSRKKPMGTAVRHTQPVICNEPSGRTSFAMAAFFLDLPLRKRILMPALRAFPRSSSGVRGGRMEKFHNQVAM